MKTIFETTVNLWLLMFLVCFVMVSCTEHYKIKCYGSANICLGHFVGTVVEETKYGYKKAYLEVQNNTLYREVVESNSKK